MGEGDRVERVGGLFYETVWRVEWKVVMGDRTERREEEEEEIQWKKKNMKDGKAAGGDGIPATVWKYRGVI